MKPEARGLDIAFLQGPQLKEARPSLGGWQGCDAVGLTSRQVATQDPPGSTNTLEDQPVQKKSQAARDSEVSIFGIDILRDVLRAVTGVPKRGVSLMQISGGDALFSFGVEMDATDFPAIARQIKGYYINDEYKTSFAWVDNVRKVKDAVSIDALNAQLVHAVSTRNPELMVTLPEIGSWDKILGFSFTRNKDVVRPVINSADYIATISDLTRITIEGLKRDRLFVHDVDGNITEHPVYRCIYFEIVNGDKTKIIFDGRWYEVDGTFISRIVKTLDLIQIDDGRVLGVFCSDKRVDLTPGQIIDGVKEILHGYFLC